MRKFKCLLTALVLVFVISASALAGDTQGPSITDPGETQTPPGETNSPPAPGETQGPAFMGSTQGPSFTDYLWAIGIELVGF